MGMMTLFIADYKYIQPNKGGVIMFSAKHIVLVLISLKKDGLYS
jgi:hypothetical protein